MCSHSVGVSLLIANALLHNKGLKLQDIDDLAMMVVAETDVYPAIHKGNIEEALFANEGIFSVDNGVIHWGKCRLSEKTVKSIFNNHQLPRNKRQPVFEVIKQFMSSKV